MPALLLHMTVAKEIAEDSRLPSVFVNAMTHKKGALILGSVLPDLPLHARFWRQCIRHILHKPYLHSEWGDVMHKNHTGTLAFSFLEHMVKNRLRAEERDELLALIVGYLTHHAFDVVVHPVVNDAVDKEKGVSSFAPIVLHTQIERYQSLFYHYDLLGYDITGTPYPRRLVAEMAGSSLFSPKLPPILWSAIRSVFLQVHGKAPALCEIKDWLRGVTSYGYLISTPLGHKIEGLNNDIETLRSLHYKGQGVDFVTPLNHAKELAFAYLRIASNLLMEKDFSNKQKQAFLQQVPNIGLDTGE